MRVNYQVWNDAFPREWQIFLTISHTARSFLPVTRCKLITNLGDLNRSHFYLNESVAGIVLCEHDLVNHARLRMPQRLRRILGSLSLVNDGT